MAEHMSIQALELDDGITHLGPINFLTPPSAASINEAIGINEPTTQEQTYDNAFNMRLGL